MLLVGVQLGLRCKTLNVKILLHILGSQKYCAISQANVEQELQ